MVCKIVDAILLVQLYVLFAIPLHIVLSLQLIISQILADSLALFFKLSSILFVHITVKFEDPQLPIIFLESLGTL